MARNDAILRLQETLLTRRNELRKRLGMELEELAHVKHSTGSGDSADAAFDSTGEELSSQLAEMEAKELRQIEAALAQLQRGTYGKCEGCNCKIPIIRLSALPYSTLCIKCQREAEQDSNWLLNRRAESNWATLSDRRDDDRPVNINALEMDLSK